MTRSIDVDGLPDLLARTLEHPHWDDVAARCLSCANCTMVCPTCFCSTVEDVNDLSGDHTERWRHWDSCFTAGHAYIHGGNQRPSVRARYRQWLTHKLGTWHEQFGTSGCVGCGRCIAWCPVGIDITAEVASLRVEAGAILEEDE
jgi:Fe-S-cluster-containing hydrogenase component 2